MLSLSDLYLPFTLPLRRAFRNLRPVRAVRVARPIGFLESIDEGGHEQLDTLLGHYYVKDLYLYPISDLGQTPPKVQSNNGFPTFVRSVKQVSPAF
jgi:hypothetical protein